MIYRLQKVPSGALQLRCEYRIMIYRLQKVPSSALQPVMRV